MKNPDRVFNKAPVGNAMDARAEAHALIDVYIESARSRSADRPHTMAVISRFPPAETSRPTARSPALRLLKVSLAAAALYAATAVISGPAPHRAQVHSSADDAFGIRTARPLRPDSFMDRLSSLEGTARALFLGRDSGPALTDRQRRMVSEAEASAGETIVVFDTTDLANIVTTARLLSSGEAFTDQLATANALLELSSQQPHGFSGAYGRTSSAQPNSGRETDRLFVGLPLTADGISQDAEDLLLLHELGHAQTLRAADGTSMREIEVLADVYAALSFIRSNATGTAGTEANLQPLHDLRDLRALMVFDRDHDSVAALDEVLSQYGNRASATALAGLDNDAVLARARAITDGDAVQAAFAVHDAALGGQQVMPALMNFNDALKRGAVGIESEPVRYEEFSSADRRYARLIASQLKPVLERTPDLGRFLSFDPDASLKALTVIGATGILPRVREEAVAVARLSDAELAEMVNNQDAEWLIRKLNRGEQAHAPGPGMH